MASLEVRIKPEESGTPSLLYARDDVMDDPDLYQYLPALLMHEFGHTFGLGDNEVRGMRNIVPNPTWFVSPSLEEQIFKSDVIVRASLLTATSSVE